MEHILGGFAATQKVFAIISHEKGEQFRLRRFCPKRQRDRCSQKKINSKLLLAFEILFPHFSLRKEFYKWHR